MFFNFGDESYVMTKGNIVERGFKNKTGWLVATWPNNGTVICHNQMIVDDFGNLVYCI